MAVEAAKLRLKNQITYLNFSPDFRSIWVGRKNGYQIFDFIDNLQDKVCLRVGEGTDVGHVRLICENPQGYNKLFCLVESPRTNVIATNVKVIPRNNLTLPVDVLEIFYGKKVIVYVTEKGIHCYNINDGKDFVVSCVRRNASIAAFSDESNVLAYFERYQQINCLLGNVVICDVERKGATKTFSSLKNIMVNELAFNKDGTLLAAAVRYHRIVHVYNVLDGEILMSFEMPYRQHIHCMNFSPDNKYIFMAFESQICGFELEPSGFHTFQHQLTNKKPVGCSLFTELPRYASLAKVCCVTVFSEPRVVFVTLSGHIYYYKIDSTKGCLTLASEDFLPYIDYSP